MWCGKRVENRTWMPPKSLIGQRIAIHAGKKYDPDDAATIASASVTPMNLLAEARQPTGIVCTVVLAGVVTKADNPRERFGFWWAGPVGWVLEDVQRLPEPIPCRGAQGLWDVPADIAARIS
jgi:hypothetical protein